MDKAELKLDLELTLNGEFHVHHHHHHTPSASQPGAAEILNSIRDLKGTIMTQLSDAVAQLKADDAQLEAEVDSLLSKLAQVPGEIAAAVQAALTNAGVDQDAAVAVMSQMDNDVRASIAKVVAVLEPTTATQITGQTGGADSQTGDSGTAPAGSATDAANAGQGGTADGVGAAAGTSTTQDPGSASTATISGGQGNDSVTSTTTSVDTGDSLVTGAGSSSTMTGGQSSDTLDATQGVDTGTGTGPGHDTISGGQATDSVQTV